MKMERVGGYISSMAQSVGGYIIACSFIMSAYHPAPHLLQRIHPVGSSPQAPPVVTYTDEYQKACHQPCHTAQHDPEARRAGLGGVVPDALGEQVQHDNLQHQGQLKVDIQLPPFLPAECVSAAGRPADRHQVCKADLSIIKQPVVVHWPQLGKTTRQNSVLIWNEADERCQ